MENIKKIVSLSTIIACPHINGGVCGDSCKVNDANAIEFENYTKLEGDQRTKVLEFITADRYGANEKNTIKKDCVVFKNETLSPGTTFFIFLFNETIYKAQTNDILKNCIKQLDNKQLYFIVGYQQIANVSIPGGGLQREIIPSSQLTLTKVDGNDNKYKLEIGGTTNPLGAIGKPPMGGSSMPGTHTSTTTSAPK